MYTIPTPGFITPGKPALQILIRSNGALHCLLLYYTLNSIKRGLIDILIPPHKLPLPLIRLISDRLCFYIKDRFLTLPMHYCFHSLDGNFICVRIYTDS